MLVMKKHKNKFIVTAAVLALLASAWFWGGAPEINHPTPGIEAEISYTSTVQPSETFNETQQTGIAEAAAYSLNYEPDEHAEANEIDVKEDNLPSDYYEYDEQIIESEEKHTETTAFDIVPEVITPSRFEQTPEGVVVPHINQANIQVFASNHSEMRAPVEPEDMEVGDGTFTVTLSVRAHTILYNMHLLHRDKHELMPEDGWIFPPTEVVAYEGESVFNVLQREMRRNRIHMVSRWTPIFNSAYVEAINNLYEFDVGPLSGWMYSVNGWFPNFGSSRYLLSDGDVIEWVYTVDLGRDLGVLWIGGEDG